MGKDESSKAQMFTAVASWMVCSVGMIVFNKKAIAAFPVACTLVAAQMLFAAVLMGTICWNTLHFGSLRDVLRWCRVVPFYVGMLLTSILALKNAPMSLVVVFRALSPLFGMVIERLYPNQMKITPALLGTMALMLAGAGLYCTGVDNNSIQGVGWVMLNNLLALCDRLLQRLMLAPDQRPVDISKTGCTLLNNSLGMFPLLVVAAISGEFSKVGGALAQLNGVGCVWVTASCLVGAGISYAGIWVQSMITATTFLVLVNTSKFIIIIFESYIMKTKFMRPLQVLGAAVTILAGVLYGKVRQSIEESLIENAEKKALIETKAI